MPSLPIFAETNSKLHADITIIRLLRAGFQADQLSAIFPQAWTPNSVSYWLSDIHSIQVASALPMAASGPLGELLGYGPESNEYQVEMDQLGLSSEMTSRLLEKVEDGRTVLCVHARSETEVAIAWHVFLHVAAEHITSPVDQVDRGSRETHSLMPQMAGVAA